MGNLTVTELSDALPKQVRGKVSEDLVNVINSLVQDPEMQEIYKENILSYTNVLSMGKFKLSNYLDAVRYVSFKLMGETNIKSYTKTFPAKYANWKQKGVSDADIAKYVHIYNKGQLVNLIWEQSMVPFHVLNQSARQEALNIQLELARTANSEKVRSDAANSILTHLKPPETAKIELDVGVKETSALASLREVSAQMAIQQKQMMEAGGMTAKEVAHQSIVIEGELEDAE